LEDEIDTRGSQGTGLVERRNSGPLAIRITQPNHKFSQVRWRCVEDMQMTLPEKAVIP
jgi:hypothetical protein